MPCSGNCCSEFYLPFDKEAIALITDAPGETEIAYIKDMVIHLTDFVNPVNGDKGGLYTCKHWNSVTKLCKEYEKRPRMCRDYPYGKKCQYDASCDLLGNARTKCQ
jgi:Fe-S-cluster containining protein